LGPGSSAYSLALASLKHSLANLINEINTDAKKIEESTAELLDQN